jgi:hypothetical protein
MRIFRTFIFVSALLLLAGVASAQTITVGQNQTNRKLMFLLVSSTDSKTPVLLATPTVTLSKNGGGFTAPAGTVTEVGQGWYSLSPTSADTNTLGSLVLHATATSADLADKEFNVVAVDPNAAKVAATMATGDGVDAATLLGRITSTRAGNLDFLDSAVSSRMATFTYMPPPTVVQIRQELDSNSTKLANLDVAISSRMAAFTYTPPPSLSSIVGGVWGDNTTYGAGTKGQQLTSAGSAGDPMSATLPGSYSGNQAGAVIAAIQTALTGVKTTTDKIGFTGTGPYFVNSQVKGIDSAQLTAIASAISGDLVDGSLTRKQVDALTLAVLTGKYTYTKNNTAHTSTTIYCRQDGTTTLATATATYTTDNTTITGRTAPVFTNLP